MSFEQRILKVVAWAVILIGVGAFVVEIFIAPGSTAGIFNSKAGLSAIFGLLLIGLILALITEIKNIKLLSNPKILSQTEVPEKARPYLAKMFIVPLLFRVLVIALFIFILSAALIGKLLD